MSAYCHYCQECTGVCAGSPCVFEERDDAVTHLAKVEAERDGWKSNYQGSESALSTANLRLEALTNARDKAWAERDAALAEVERLKGKAEMLAEGLRRVVRKDPGTDQGRIAECCMVEVCV